MTYTSAKRVAAKEGWVSQNLGSDQREKERDDGEAGMHLKMLDLCCMRFVIHK